MANDRLFGLRVEPGLEMQGHSTATTVRTLGGTEIRSSTNGEWWVWPEITLERRPPGDPLTGAALAQLMANPSRVYELEAFQLENGTDMTGYPSPKATAALTGGELSLPIEFSANITTAQAPAYLNRLFTIGDHKKLYWCSELGIAGGAKAGTMKFFPNAQHQVSIGETLNFINPKVRVALAPGFHPGIMVDADGMREIKIALQEVKSA